MLEVNQISLEHHVVSAPVCQGNQVLAETALESSSSFQGLVQERTVANSLHVVVRNWKLEVSMNH